MLTSLSVDVVTSELDNVCKKIIRTLRKKNHQNYASLERSIKFAPKTRKEHIKHLVKGRFVEDKKVTQGTRRDFHLVNLTKRGRSIKL